MENQSNYSVEITDLIGTTPKWVLRAGSGLLLLLLILALGLASVVSIPEQNSSTVFLRASTPAYYVRQVSESMQLLVLSGQRVQRGQCVARGMTPVRVCVYAPFSGTLYYEDKADNSRRVGDTLALVVPLATSYQFHGQLPLAWVQVLQKQPRIAIEVPLYNQLTSVLVLRGHLRYVKPVMQHGELSYQGELDSASSVALRQHFAAITQLEGTLLLSSQRAPLLRRLFN